MKFFQDLFSRTLQRRAEKIPQLIQERKKAMWLILFQTDLSFTKAERKGIMSISHPQMVMLQENFLASDLLLLNLDDQSRCVERSSHLFLHFIFYRRVKVKVKIGQLYQLTSLRLLTMRLQNLNHLH